MVGAGILGLAHAYHLARRGRRVIVFERNPRASGASVRNFGMLWPIGQPFGPLRRLADEKPADLARGAGVLSGLWHERTGSLHLAYRDDEAQVLREFAQECAEHGEPVDLLTPEQVRERTTAVKHDGLQLALSSPQRGMRRPARGRGRTAGLALPVASASISSSAGRSPPSRCRTLIAGNARWSADRLWICSGDELKLLFADAVREMRPGAMQAPDDEIEPCGAGWRIGPMLAAGLTLRHYASFQNCPSLPAPSPPGRPGNTLVRSLRNSCAGFSERPGRIDHRRLA